MTKNLSQLSDDALVELCQRRGAKDDRPFTELYNRHKHLVWRICFRFTNTSQEAEDLMQEVFFKTYRGLPGFEGKSSFKTWLYQIALNTGRNELRRKSRRPQVSDTPVELLTGTSSTQNGLERLERLEDVFSRLHPEERQALILKDLEGFSYSEFARSLEISLSAAKMRVLRARRAFQKIYLRTDTEE